MRYIKFLVVILCSMSLFSCANYTRKKLEAEWEARNSFNKNSTDLIEGTYKNKIEGDKNLLWKVISTKKRDGDSVKFKKIDEENLQIELLNKGVVVDKIKRKITDRGSFWTIGSSSRIGMTPIGPSIVDNRSAITTGDNGDLYICYGTGGTLWIMGILPISGGGYLHSSIYERN